MTDVKRALREVYKHLSLPETLDFPYPLFDHVYEYLGFRNVCTHNARVEALFLEPEEDKVLKI
jgi:hypothetical protein